VKLLLANLQATEKLGNFISQSITDSALIALSGKLGSGKTTLVKSLASGLGVKQVVTSPTFLVMNEYHDGRLPLFHLDLYRFADSKVDLSFFAQELDELASQPCVIVVEWAEFFLLDENERKELNFFYKQDHLKINLEYLNEEDSGRQVEITAEGLSSEQILSTLSKMSTDMLIYS
jgi:tRNA threonylcarbamoyladenosine biosynthesis protein TsaE